METQASDFTRIYWVRAAPRGWRLERAGEGLATFADLIEAVARACDGAKADAEKGYVATVTVETHPREFHCYAPSPGRPSRERPSSAYLRLLG